MSAVLMKQIEPTTLCEIPQFLKDTTSLWIKTDVCTHIHMSPSLSYWCKEELGFPISHSSPKLISYIAYNKICLLFS